VHVRNVRNIAYRSTSDYDVRHYDAAYDLDALDSVWYLVALRFADAPDFSRRIRGLD
jgi:hypothetical protein